MRSGAVNPDDLIEVARAAREIVLRQSRRANVGHIGSALSVIGS